MTADRDGDSRSTPDGNVPAGSGATYSETSGPLNNGSETRDYTAARRNPRAKWQCGYLTTGTPCPHGPDASGKCGRPASETASEAADNTVSASGGAQEVANRCVPHRTAWAFRRWLAVNAAVLTAGVLLLCMALPVREQVFVPGGLSATHSQILGNQVVGDRCSSCHAPVHGTWIAALSEDSIGPVHDSRCMDCHDAHMPDASRASPHDLASNELTLVGLRLGLKLEDLSPTQCASCHNEHHGAKFDIQAISDSRCQACHDTKFHSLSDGHPEFESYPYRTERSVKFSHSAHALKHFAQKGQEFDCRGCHISDDDTKVVRTLGFDQACGSCHSESIGASIVDGWAILQLPSLSPDYQNDLVEVWPSGAQFGFEADLGATARTLLSGTVAEEIMSAWPADGQLGDINDPAQRKTSVLAAAGAMKSLIEELALDGQTRWREQLIRVAEKRLNRHLDSNELRLVDEMTTGVPPNLFRQIVTNWFGENEATTQPVSKPEENGDGGAKLISGRQDLLNSNSESTTLPADDLFADLLGEPAGDGKEAEASKQEFTLQGETAQRPAEVPAADRHVEFDTITGSRQVAVGGWFLDHELFELRYQPRGHGDKTLAAWSQYLDLIGEANSTQRDAILSGCIECHELQGKRLDDWADWKSVSRPANVKPFTKFDHTPHLTLSAINDCQHCHRLKNSGLMPVSDSIDWQADFQPMRLEQCVDCHRRGGAKDACTTCHNYHVGSDGFEWSRKAN